jgi:hypothetical protein
MGQIYVGSMFSFFPCLRPIFPTHNIYNKRKGQKKKGIKKVRWGGLAKHPSALFSSSFYFV